MCIIDLIELKGKGTFLDFRLFNYEKLPDRLKERLDNDSNILKLQLKKEDGSKTDILFGSVDLTAYQSRLEKYAFEIVLPINFLILFICIISFERK